MEKLATDIVIKGILEENFHDDKLKKRLLAFPPLEFIPIFLAKMDIQYNSIFFLSTLSYWESLDYSDWKQLLFKVSHSGQGTQSFFVITYKYLKIDMFPFFKNLKTSDDVKRDLLLKCFFEYPHILQHDDEAKVWIEMYSLDEECLIRIRTKLLEQGAIKAQRIEPRKKTKVGFTIIEPPSSWQVWAKDLYEQ